MVSAVAALAAAVVLAGPASAQTTTNSTGVCVTFDVCQEVESDATVVSQLADTADGVCAIVGERPPPESGDPRPLILQPEVCVRMYDPEPGGPVDTDRLYLLYGDANVATYRRREHGPCHDSHQRGFEAVVRVYDKRTRTYC
jgi:hypothetical protein